MPKPTFFQAVLHKPSRSYANPDAPRPWADDDVHDVHRPPQRQPSLPTHVPSYSERLARPSSSVVSAASDGPRPRRRPKATSYKAASTLASPPASSIDTARCSPVPQATPSRLAEPSPPRATRGSSIPPVVEGLFTPPDSDLSSVTTPSVEAAASTPSVILASPISVMPTAKLSSSELPTSSAAPTALAESVEDEDSDIFYTPNTSMANLVLAHSDGHLVAPVLHLQPPTPAPKRDPIDSPFGTAVTKSTLPTLQANLSATPGELLPAGPPASDASHGSHETSSITSDAGSTAGAASPPAAHRFPPSHASSSNSASPEHSRSPSRRSNKRSPRPSYDEFVVHRRNSLAPSEGSVMSLGAYGKGGWAAAAASRSASPVMFMPANGGDGWTAFQAPARQSRFTPMPSLSTAATPQSDVGRFLGPPSVTESLPSAYSQPSDEEPVPSRSYIKHASTPSSRSDSDERYPPSVPPPARTLSPSAYPIDRLPSRPQSPSQYSTVSAYDAALSGLAGRVELERPSFLHPDTLTFLPEMSSSDSDRLYQRPPSEGGRTRRSIGDVPRRPSSVIGGLARYARSEASVQDDRQYRPSRSRSVASSAQHETAARDGGVLMESHGREQVPTGYTGAYNPANPAKANNGLDARILGLPHATMAAITMTSARRSSIPTPAHLRSQLPPPLDFSSHLPPPTKVSSSQVLVQVYAVAIDASDVAYLDQKGQGDVGKWVPGRSFVGRCLSVGVDEREIIRGDIVIGLLDLRKSGALAEYVACDRRRLARAPSSASLTIEQMALLPLQGLPTLRAIAVTPPRGTHALILDAHIGVAALVCQALNRSGVCVTAIIPGGDAEAQARCMSNGARGVLIGSAVAVMHGLEEDIFEYVLDTIGGQRVYEAARRIIKDGGRLVTLCEPDSSMTVTPISAKSSSIKTFRAAFASRRKTSKSIAFEHVCSPGTGEPELDASGLDRRDMLEEAKLAALEPTVGEVVRFEKGASAFQKSATSVIRIIN